MKGRNFLKQQCSALRIPCFDIRPVCKADNPALAPLKLALITLLENKLTPNCATYFPDYLGSKFIRWLIRSSYKLLHREDDLHLPAHDQPNPTINKSNLFFYLVCVTFFPLFTVHHVQWGINEKHNSTNTFTSIDHNIFCFWWLSTAPCH